MVKAPSRAVWAAVAAAALYALNAPFSKLLLKSVAPTMLAALLYLGAGLGTGALRLIRRSGGQKSLTRADLPYTLAMVVLDIAAPILLMTGLKSTAAANAALLNNFEIVATALIALLVFREKISARLWVAIGLITLAGILLSVEGTDSLQFSGGSPAVLGACVCWGLENNCTRAISQRDPLQIVVVKGFGSGLGALGIAFCLGERMPAALPLVCALVLGFVAYGLSIACYIYAQRHLGAAKTSAYYAIAPFVGVALSCLTFWQWPGARFWLALAVMAAGTYFAQE